MSTREEYEKIYQKNIGGAFELLDKSPDFHSAWVTYQGIKLICAVLFWIGQILLDIRDKIK